MRPAHLVALALAVGGVGLAHAQPAVDESPDAPPAAAAPEAAPAADEAAEAPADAPPADAPAADAPAADAPAADAPGDAAAASPGLDATKTPNANVQAAPVDDGLPAWEPAPVSGGGDATGSATPGNSLQANWDAGASPAADASFPWFEHHGYFRTRGDLFYNFDLDTTPDAGVGSSPVPPPTNGGDSQASTNLRFRYQPTVHISETLRVKSTLDILDNLVLGSTPDGGAIGGSRLFTSRPEVPIETFSGTQTPPEAGINGYRDSVRVKHLWGEWKTPLGLLAFGRMQSHWGLGVLANNGNCLDCDFGDSVDRIMGVSKLFGTYIAMAWDFPSEGLVGFSGQHDNINQRQGQQFDIDQRDDVNEWVIALFDKPVTREEQEARVRDLNEVRKPVFDWGVYTVFRNQDRAVENSSSQPATGANDPAINSLNSETFAFIPDVWLNWEYRPTHDTRYQLQLEIVGILGTIEDVPIGALQSKDEVVCTDESIGADEIDNCPESQRIYQRKREVQQWGYALEFDASYGKLTYGFHQGGASGDRTDGFGVLDKAPIDPNQPLDQDLTNFRFDRDYIVDMIMFREVIGAVTNALYFKPYVGYNFVQDDREAWGFKVSAIYGRALEAQATPGNDANLGLEFDAEVFIHEFDRFRWSVAYGVWFPMAAFNRLDATGRQILAEPSAAQTLQAMIGMQF